ncbi:MAG: hypothetical protein MUE42_09915 [Opitutaceae bacterium]|nr:hypothetical protein [Opitutaceae bacterium]
MLRRIFTTMTTPAPAPAPGPRPERKPWPLRWIVLTILVVIVPYTYVNLKFRKPNKAFEPYADMMAQANVNRLLDAGFRRVSLPVAPAPSNGGETRSRRLCCVSP